MKTITLLLSHYLLPQLIIIILLLFLFLFQYLDFSRGRPQTHFSNLYFLSSGTGSVSMIIIYAIDGVPGDPICGAMNLGRDFAFFCVCV